MNTSKMILMLVDLILTGVTVLPEVRTRMEEYRSKLAQMVAEGRNPTDAEWDQLNADIMDTMSSLEAKTTKGKASR